MKKVYLLSLTVVLALGLSAQGIFSNAITDANPASQNPFTAGQVTDPNVSASGIGRGPGLNGSSASNRYSSSGWTTGASQDENDYLEFTLNPATGYKINFTSFEYTGQRSGTGPQNFALRSSIDGFATDIGTFIVTGTTIDLSASRFQHISEPVTFRIYGWNATAAGGTFSINDFIFNGSLEPSGSAGPVITVHAALVNFSSVVGSPSAEQSYLVSGSLLTAPIQINAPTGYEISTASGSGFETTVSLSPTSGMVNSTIYIRQRSATAGGLNGTIAHVSAGAVTINLELAGKVLGTEPTSQPVVSVSEVTGHSFRVSFSGGNGSGRLVVIRPGLSVSNIPEDGTDYTANSNFGSGQVLGAGEYVVYKGSGNTVLVNNLSGGTTYHIAVFEYNDAGVAAATNYNPSAATAQQLTAAAPQGVQLLALNTPVTIDFDNSSSYANNGQWNGTGFSASPVSGQLNSGAWSVSGWSDGDLNFNETKTTGDYARGFTASHPSTGGMYAFEPLTAGNRALGIQPGTGDWVPGHLTLRLQNATGVALNSLKLSYKLFVFNNADRSSAFNFSYSIDNTVFTEVSSLNYHSAEAADASPSWIQVDRSFEINNINLLPGQFIYLRWSGSDVAGAGSRDEFALDDISVIAQGFASAPLPVRFSAVAAVRRTGTVQINWMNDTEENVVRYHIERSADGKNFERIGTVESKNNDGAAVGYSFTDILAPVSLTYYRITCLETDGNITQSKVVRVTGLEKDSRLSVFPNPVTGHFVDLKVNLEAGRYQIRIVNLLGQEVFHTCMEHRGGPFEQKIETREWASGLYLVQVLGKQAFISRFIKE